MKKTKTVKQLSIKSLRTLLCKRFHGVIKSGTHVENGECCIRELRACALGIDWNDHPDGELASPTDSACQRLNDSAWSSDVDRTEACLPLALISEHTAPRDWYKTYALLTVKRLLPFLLRRCGLEGAAVACEIVTTLAEASRAANEAARAARAASDAASYAASAASYAASYAASGAARAASCAASYAASGAARAASAASYAASGAARDEILKLGISILLESHKS